MLNQVILTGNLGDDPSSHYTSEGLAITHLNIAFKSSSKKKDANWIKVSCFGKPAELVSTYLHKGAIIAVVGVLDQNKWTTDDGQNRSTFQLIADYYQVATSGCDLKDELCFS
jgi:single-strand DNA-binding protein